MILEILAIAFFAKIAWYDIRTQMIKNSDLLATALILLMLYWRNWLISFLNFTIYLMLYFISQRKLGEGV
jgi:hypothetical protein